MNILGNKHPFLQSNGIEYKCGNLRTTQPIPDTCPKCGAELK